MNNSTRLLAAIAAGTVVALALALLGFGALRFSWPAYAAAEPNKAYSLAMLLSRLTLGVLCTGVAGAVAARVAPDDRRAPWLLGALVLAVSIPGHLYPGYLWNDYPAWYHLVYLAYLVPIAGLAGRRSQAMIKHQA